MPDRTPPLLSVIIPGSGASLEDLAQTLQSVPAGAQTIAVCDSQQADSLAAGSATTLSIQTVSGQWHEQFKPGLASARGVFACWLRPPGRFICPSWTWLEWLAGTNMDVVYARAAIVDAGQQILWFRGAGEFDPTQPLVWFSQRIPGQPIFARRERLLEISSAIDSAEPFEWEAQCTHRLLKRHSHRLASEAVTSHPTLSEIDLVDNPLWVSAVTRLADAPDISVCQVWSMLRRATTENAVRSNARSNSPAREGRLVAAIVVERLERIASSHARIALFGAGKHTQWLVQMMARATEAGRKLPQVSCILDDRADHVGADHPCPVKQPAEFHPTDGSAIVLSTDVWQREFKERIAKAVPHSCDVLDLYERLGPGPFVKAQAGQQPCTSELWEHRMASFKDKHLGQRCFILGNGPSLNRTDLSLLADEVTFATNRIYLITPRTGFQPTYYVCTNKYVLQDRAEEIRRLPYPKFIRYYPDHAVWDDPNVFYYQVVDGEDVRFSTEPWRTMNEGGTVTYVCLQLAYFMGFKEVVLIGVDHNFPNSGTPNKLVVADRADSNHFDPNYFGTGSPWQYPDLLRCEHSYGLAREKFQADERRVVDATIGGKLEVFPKVDYHDLFTCVV